MTHFTFTDQNMNLPIELIDQILSHLSPRHLINTALVCHSWARLARCQLYKDIYIHTNRQYTRWLESLDSICLEHRRLVRSIVIHPQVHLDLCDDLAILRLCPWVESFDIGNKITKSGNGYISRRSKETNIINDMIGRRNRYPQLLHYWQYLKRLDGYHGDPPTTWTCASHLTSLVCSFDDICTLLSSPQPLLLLSDLVDLHLTFGCLDMPVTTLESIHVICPALETLKLHVQSIHGITTTVSSQMVTTGDPVDDVSPVLTLKSLSLDGMVHFDPGCYTYLLCKYPLLDTLHLGFVFDEFYTSHHQPIMGDHDDDGDLCAYLQKNQSDLFDLISGYHSLTRLEIHLQGANEYITSLWPSEQMTKWMQQGNNKIDFGGNGTTKPKCGLRHLEMTYQRQSTEDNHDILGLDGIINSWVGQYQLQTLSLDVYNNGRSNNNNNCRTIDTSIQSTLDTFFHSDHFFASGTTTSLLRNMTTLSIKCFPGFDISLSCLLNGLPSLKILDLAYGHFITRMPSSRESSSSSYGLQQLILGSCTLSDTGHFMELIQHHCQHLTTLCFENVVFDESTTHIWDFSHHGLKYVWIKYLSFDTKVGMVNWLKVHESTANRSTWYHTSMAQGTHGSSKPFDSSVHGLPGTDSFENGGISIELKCYFVEDILFC